MRGFGLRSDADIFVTLSVLTKEFLITPGPRDDWRLGLLFCRPAIGVLISGVRSNRPTRGVACDWFTRDCTIDALGPAETTAMAGEA